MTNTSHYKLTTTRVGRGDHYFGKCHRAFSPGRGRLAEGTAFYNGSNSSPYGTIHGLNPK